MNSKSKSRIFRDILIVALVIFLLISLPQVFFPSSIPRSTASASSSNSPGSNQYQDRALSLDSSQGRVTLNLLNSLSEGQQTVSAYENVLSSYFLPLNIRQVLLDIGWENYTIGNIPNETWVSNWLTACDALGVRNLFYLGQFTNSGIGSPWIMSLIKSEPSTQTYNSNGEPVNYVSFDNPYVAKAVESDLAILYSYYGNHTSWVGLGTGSAQDNPYYGGNGTLPSIGYSNSTVQQFANSVYFQRDVNQSGYLPKGALDPLWASFKNIGNSISLSSGNYVNPSPFRVYGNESFAQILSMRFYIPTNEQSIQIQWYGNVVGNPSDLKTIIYSDQGGAFSPTQTPIAVKNESSSGISSTSGWENPISYTGSFSAGYYWIIFEASSANDQNYYNIYSENQANSNSTASSIFSNSGFSLGRAPYPIGSAILWVKDQNGSTLSVYPYLSTASSQLLSQSFTTSRSFSFNTVFLYIGPKQFSSANATVSVIDETSGGQVAAQGVLSQNAMHGLEGWVPVTLGNTVNAQSGRTYQIQISPQPYDNSWYRVIQSLVSNPSVGGFENQGQYWLFQLGLLGFAQTHFDYTSVNAGPNAVKLNESLAFPFVPSTSESLQAVKLLMSSKAQGSFYSNASSLTVSLYSNFLLENSPGTRILQSVTIPSQVIPLNGLLTVPGFNYQLTGGQQYWIVLSSSDPVGYTFAQFGNPYFSQAKLQLNGGPLWFDLAPGASDLNYEISLSGQTIGNVVSGISTASLSSPSTIFAQPFNVSSPTGASGLFLGPIISRGVQSPNNQLIVSLQEDNGKGLPTGLSLASGSIGIQNITSSSLSYVGFASIVKLQPGLKYWIVIQPKAGSYFVQADTYSSTPKGIPQGYTALLSTDNGVGWSNLTESSTGISVLPYSLVIPYSSHQTFNTTGIYSELLYGHTSSPEDGLLRGWNAYIQASEANMFDSVFNSFLTLTGKSLVFSLGIDQNVVSQLGYSSYMLGVGSSTSNCADLINSMFTNMPLRNEQYSGASNSTVIQSCLGTNADALAADLNYIIYAHHNNGFASNSKVLIIGDNGPQNNLTFYLSNAYSLTYSTLGSNPSLFLPGGLSPYSTVVWLSSTSPDLGYSVALRTYLNNGGKLIVLGASSPSSSLVSSWLFSFLGFDPSNIPGSNETVQSSAKALFYSITANTPYNQSLTFESLNSSISIATGSGVTLSENIVNSTTDGNVIFIQFTKQNIAQLPQLSSQLVVLSNAIAHNLKNVGKSPFFYGPGTVSELTSGVVYSITGGEGTPLLVWLSNPTSSSVDINLELNGSFYGLPQSWNLFYPDTLVITSGNSSFVSISTTISPQSWRLIYVLPDSKIPGELYSNVLLKEQFAYPNQGLYYFEGVQNQSVLTAINSRLPIQNVSLNDLSNLTQASNASSLIYQTRQGWFYDNNSNILFVKYVSNGNDSLRIFYSPLRTTTRSGVLHLYPSTFEFAITFLVVAGISAGAYGYVQFRTKKVQK